MYQNWQYEIDPKAPLKPLYQGSHVQSGSLGRCSDRRRLQGAGGLPQGFGMDIRETPEFRNRKDCPLPVWMFGGEQEPWLLDHIPTNDNATGDSIRIWRGNNHLTPEIPASWEDGWTVNGRWHDLHYTNADGAPMVNYTWVDYMPHATMTEMSFRIWEEFFSKFSRADGEIRYHPS